MKFSIRQATLDDFSKIQALSQALFDEEYGLGHDDDLDLTWPQESKGRAYYKLVLTNPKYLTLIAEDLQKQPVGLLVGCAKNKFSWRKVSMGELEELYVSPAARRQGVAQALVKKLGEWLRNRGVKRIYVAAYYLNKEAHGFYQKVGFSPWDIALEKRLERQ